MKLTEETLSFGATTTSFSRLRGKTLWIMEILQDGGSLASWQIAEQTMKSSNYVNVYLFRLRKHGIAKRHDGFWYLTDFGKDLTSLLTRDDRDRDRDRDRYNTSTTQQQHNNNTSPQKRLVQVSIQAWLRDSSPPDAERGVVDLLVSHYNKTGSKFVLVKDHYAMSDLLSINVHEVPDVLSRLRQENIIYLMRDPTSGQWKLGLKKAFLELLERAR
jgi:transcription initiation factor IIE alpha subunit